MRTLALVLSMSLTACAARPSPEVAPRAPIEGEGEVVRAAPDPLTGLSSYDPALLFHLAEEEERRGHLRVACALYLRLAREFAGNARAPLSLFRGARLTEEHGDLAAAAVLYEELLRLDVKSDEARRVVTDAHYRLAAVLMALGEHLRAIAAYERIFKLAGLDAFNLREATLGLGKALRRVGQIEAAVAVLEGEVRKAERVGERARDGGLLAEVAYELGEMAEERFFAERLELPVSLLRARFVTKCELLLAAERHYLRAIRHGDARMATAAGYRVGALYEALHTSLFAVEIPPELDLEEAEVYREEVRRRVSILLEKAIVIYEKTLFVGRGARGDLTWISRLEEALARLRMAFVAAP